MPNLFVASVLAGLVVANSIPIYGSYPGWVVGSGRANINVEIALDLVCTDSQANNPIWNQVLASPWLDGTVQDQVYWAYSTYPLPYHVHTFQVTQLVPYFQALCAEQGNCLLDQYKDWCFEDAQILTTLSETNVSQTDFETEWAQKVATQFNLDYNTVYSIYNPATD